MLRSRLLIIGLIITSCLGFLRWPNHEAFLFEIEWEILQKASSDLMSILHPITVIPMLGQLILLVNLFKKNPSKVLTYIGMGCISVIMIMVMIVGVLGPDYLMIGSTLPFFLVVFRILTLKRRARINKLQRS